MQYHLSCQPCPGRHEKSSTQGPEAQTNVSRSTRVPATSNPGQQVCVCVSAFFFLCTSLVPFAAALYHSQRSIIITKQQPSSTAHLVHETLCGSRRPHPHEALVFCILSVPLLWRARQGGRRGSGESYIRTWVSRVIRKSRAV